MRQGNLFDTIDTATGAYGPRSSPPTNGTATSAAAARAIAPVSGQQRQAVLWVLREFPGGLTDEQLIDATGLSPSSVRPRRGELVAAGLVRDSGTTRATRSGRQAVVWLATAP